MSWKTNKKKVSVYRCLGSNVVDYEEELTYNEEADKTLERLTITDLSNNNLAVEQYGKEAIGRIRIKLDRNEKLGLNDLIEWNGNRYIVDTEEVTYRLFRTIEAKRIATST